MGEFFSASMRTGAAPSGTPTSYKDKAAIDQLLAATDPAAVGGAGMAYQAFAGGYEKFIGRIQSLGVDLDDAWKGQGAAAAQSQLREVWASANIIQDSTHRFGVALERHGTYLAFYANNKPPSKNLHEAQQWMTGANQRITETWGSIPPDLTTTLPPAKRFDDPGPVSSGPPGGPSSSGNGPVGPSSHGGGGTAGNLSSGGSHTHPGYGHGGADLAGLSPTAPGGGSATLSPGTGPGGVPGSGATGPLGLGGGGLGAGGGSYGPVIGGPSGITSGLDSGERTPGGSGGLSAEEASAAEANATRNAATRQGMGGPMGGGGGGRGDERECTRETWLTEDEDLWTGDTEVAPPVLGATGDDVKARQEPDAGLDEDPSIAELEAQLAALKATGVNDKKETELSLDDILGEGWDSGLDV